MPQMTRRTLGDLALCAAVVAGSAVLFIGAADLPPPRFEPLGSAAAPRILGAILIVLAAVVAVQSVLQPEADDTPEAAPTPWRGTLVLAALVLYVASLDMIRVPFIVATPLFVIASGLVMSRPTLRNAVMFAALGLGIALLLDWVLTRFLYVQIG